MTAKLKAERPHLRGELSTVLTPREQKVVELRAKGMDTRHIAKQLKIKPKTVTEFQSEIYRKTQSGNMVQVIIKWIFARGRI